MILENDRVKLVDIENGILGVPSFYRPYFMQHRKINTIQAIDVYGLGHTLYEMAFGAPLHESVYEQLPSGDISQELRQILESILLSEACKNGLPTVDELLNNPFFSRVHLTYLPTDKAHFKVSNGIKEHLKQIVTQIEDRLRDEQKVVRSQKRIARVQEMMTSEEEKKKQRQKIVRSVTTRLNLIVNHNLFSEARKEAG